MKRDKRFREKMYLATPRKAYFLNNRGISACQVLSDGRSPCFCCFVRQVVIVGVLESRE